MMKHSSSGSRISRWSAAFLSALLLLAGCRLPHGITPWASLPMSHGSGATSQALDAPLTGRVAFPRRSAQATLETIATAATVSLINTGSNRTEATTLTDETGRFAFTFGKKFTPDPTATYYLEASKGLSNNLPGSDNARVRTIARYQNGWLTVTNTTPNQGIVLNASTTALSIGAALKAGTATPVAFADLLGCLTVGTPDSYAPIANLSGSDYSTLLTMVIDALAADQDPVAAIRHDAGTSAWIPANPGQGLRLSMLTPASGSIGTGVTAAGSGFTYTPSEHTLRFNGTAASVSAAIPTSLTATVPTGATSGQTTVQVGSTIALGPLFTVNVQVTGFSPASGSAGTSVTITGTGFDTSNLANNAVSFGGVTGTVTAVTPGTLTATVPTGATSAPLTVTVSGSSTTAASFTVPVVVSSFSPTGGTVGTSVTLSGSGFSSIGANNSVRFNGVDATVTSASPTSLTVTAPSGASTGPTSVTVAGQTGTSAGHFSFVIPALQAVHQPLAKAGSTVTLEGMFGPTATVNFPGGVSTAATVLGLHRAQVAVPAGATSGNLTVTTNGTTTAAQSFRAPSYAPALAPRGFSLQDDQATHPRQGFTLTTARHAHTSAVIGNNLYVVGGYGSGTPLNTVERATTNPDGTISAFSSVAGVTLATARHAHTSAVIGNYLYVVGGNGSGGILNTVERATINPDGTISAFSSVAGVTLATARHAHTSAVIGNYLYVAGGNGSGGILNTVERATLQ